MKLITSVSWNGCLTVPVLLENKDDLFGCTEGFYGAEIMTSKLRTSDFESNKMAAKMHDYYSAFIAITICQQQ